MPRTLRARYLRPVTSGFRWSVILSWSFMVLVALGISGIAFLTIKSFVQPWLNLPLFVIGALLAFAGPIYALFDLQRYQPHQGLIFEDEWLYIYQLVRKVKLKYSDVKSVTFFPALIQTKQKDRRAGKRAWARIQTKYRSYYLMIPHYEDAFPQLEKYHIPFHENRKALPLVTVGILISGLFLAAIPLFLLFYVLAFRRFFSDNGSLSRKAEVFIPSSLFGFVILVASAFPISKVDRQVTELIQSIRRNEWMQVSAYCKGLEMTEHPRVLTKCAQALVYSGAQEMRDPKRAQLMATEAVNSSRNLKEMKAAADILACASMALGQQTYALKVAQDYELPERTEQFKQNQYCKGSVVQIEEPQPIPLPQ